MEPGVENTWIVSAEHELDAAQLLFEQGGYLEVAAHHIHQGLERYLKGFLASRGAAVHPVHDLGELVRRCAQVEPEMLRFVEDVQPLTVYFVDTLESELVLPEPSRDDIRHALQIAWRLRQRLATLMESAESA